MVWRDLRILVQYSFRSFCYSWVSAHVLNKSRLLSADHINTYLNFWVLSRLFNCPSSSSSQFWRNLLNVVNKSGPGVYSTFGTSKPTKSYIFANHTAIRPCSQCCKIIRTGFLVCTSTENSSAGVNLSRFWHPCQNIALYVLYLTTQRILHDNTRGQYGRWPRFHFKLPSPDGSTWHDVVSKTKEHFIPTKCKAFAHWRATEKIWLVQE